MTDTTTDTSFGTTAEDNRRMDLFNKAADIAERVHRVPYAPANASASALSTHTQVALLKSYLVFRDHLQGKPLRVPEGERRMLSAFLEVIDLLERVHQAGGWSEEDLELLHAEVEEKRAAAAEEAGRLVDRKRLPKRVLAAISKPAMISALHITKGTTQQSTPGSPTKHTGTPGGKVRAADYCLDEVANQLCDMPPGAIRVPVARALKQKLELILAAVALHVPNP